MYSIILCLFVHQKKHRYIFKFEIRFLSSETHCLVTLFTDVLFRRRIDMYEAIGSRAVNIDRGNRYSNRLNILITILSSIAIVNAFGIRTIYLRNSLYLILLAFISWYYFTFNLFYFL